MMIFCKHPVFVQTAQDDNLKPRAGMANRIIFTKVTVTFTCEAVMAVFFLSYIELGR